MAAVLVLGGILVLGPGDRKPILEPTYFLLYILTCSRFYTPLKKISRLNINWQEAKVSANRIQEVLHTLPAVRESANPKPIARLDRTIEFQNVSFAYGEKQVLSQVSFAIPAGKVVALVGPSGAGKTTIANLLPRLMDPTAGRVLFDGIDARELSLSDLRQMFGVVTQDTVLFNDTVERNIAYTDKEIDRERLVRAAQAAYADDFIRNLRGGDGYKTIIGQSGQRLSGGQRQRLAIARALYRDPQILIFDEATSSLDVESEKNVQAAIDNLLQDRTALLIAHRLSTIRHADEILVLRNGEIIERGNHHDLMELRGEYWKQNRLAADLENLAPAGRQLRNATSS